jgi:parvulin-like peptidyl-prolyl isomerase
VSREKGRKGKPAARDGAVVRRQGLLAFGVLFVALFAVVAITEGIGDPDIPDGAIAVIEDAPEGLGEITQEEFDHALELSASESGGKAPKPGDPNYEEAKEGAFTSLVQAIWIQGEAAEHGIEPTQAEVNKELKKIKKESFPTEAEFQKFLKESGYTPGDVIERVKLQTITNQILEEFKEEAPKPSQDEIEDYYEAAKDSQFRTKAGREFRAITNKDRAKVEEALEALSKDNSAANWKKVAKKYSTDPNTKENGGLNPEVQEGTIQEPLNAAIFAAAEGRLEGPLNTGFGLTIFEVIKSTPEKVQDLESVEEQIESTLTRELEQEYIQDVGTIFTAKWVSRTFCAPEYVAENCENFEKGGPPQGASPACYEADPEGGRPEACPAPVFQLVPAQPGSVTILARRGKPLAQRPRPAGDEEASSGEAAGLPEEEEVPPPPPPSE